MRFSGDRARGTWAMDRGYIHVYTGEGKGKTTAALGLVLRALGAGLRAGVVQFIKSMEYSEIRMLRRLGVPVRQFGRGCFIRGEPSPEDKKAAESGLDFVRRMFATGGPSERMGARRRKGSAGMAADGLYCSSHERGGSGNGGASCETAPGDGPGPAFAGLDVLVLDEINIAMKLGLLDAGQVLETLRLKPAGMEVICTGRGAPRELVEAADLVTEMRNVKHYYDAGVKARDGIER
ncbi:MAG: cob(I)yrinic acid a,c-diamide adenosyltransferase [Planctomycetota bacterium]|nr:cob(I)yrinic acid a,c-diamide adenosyltransferase [Planctomycetota bacterium]